MKQAIIVTDLSFGDAGKGSAIDFLARLYQAHTVIRFNGGAQAAHNVVTPDGRHHTFAQFGSGTFIPGVRTYLSRFMFIDPYAMFNEEQHLGTVGVDDAFSRTLLDRRAPIITPFQQAVNRLKEIARSADRHGSCGMGIGETMSDLLRYPDDVLYAGDLPNREVVCRKLRFLRDLKYSQMADWRPLFTDSDAAQADWRLFESPTLIDAVADNYADLAAQIQIVDESAWQNILDDEGVILFEGAQGVLLDENYGFAPYTTWSSTTAANALTLLEGYIGELRRLGVFRVYFTRHGAGPFVTEDASLTLPEDHNSHSAWQGAFRVGNFDLVAARYALEVSSGIDGLIITHVDRLRQMAAWKLCTAYRSDEQPDTLTSYFEGREQTITAIKVRQPPDWDHQERLTCRLAHCTPRYQVISDHREAAYLSALEEGLGAPIVFTSTGPTANDKQVIQSPWNTKGCRYAGRQNER